MLAIFLDIETTGLDYVRHRAIDIALKVVDLTTGEVKGAYQSVVRQPEDVWNCRDLASMEINGYTWETVIQGKSPDQVKEEVLSLLTQLGIARGKAFFICQNPGFDRGFFAHIIDVYTQEKMNWPYHWLDLASMYWALLIQKDVQNHLPLPETINLSKNEIAGVYHLPPESLPHKAQNGVDHLILCYQAVVGFSQNIKAFSM